VPEGRQLARVAVSDETWTAFRGAALTQGISVAGYLGRLVEAEVGRRQMRRVAGVRLDDPPAEQALQALAEARASIDELDGIACRRSGASSCTLTSMGGSRGSR
jgi:hypothetical protein